MQDICGRQASVSRLTALSWHIRLWVDRGCAFHSIGRAGWRPPLRYELHPILTFAEFRWQCITSTAACAGPESPSVLCPACCAPPAALLIRGTAGAGSLKRIWGSSLIRTDWLDGVRTCRRIRPFADGGCATRLASATRSFSATGVHAALVSDPSGEATGYSGSLIVSVLSFAA